MDGSVIPDRVMREDARRTHRNSRPAAERFHRRAINAGNGVNARDLARRSLFLSYEMPGQPLSQSYGNQGHIIFTKSHEFMVAAFRS
jgi:hypothetical protein